MNDLASDRLPGDVVSWYLALVANYPQATDGERCYTRNVTRQLRSYGIVSLLDLLNILERHCVHNQQLPGDTLGGDTLDSDLEG